MKSYQKITKTETPTTFETERQKKQDLLMRLDTLKIQSDRFIDWYIQALNRSPYIGSRWDDTCVYLKYDGDDPDLIERLFRAFCRLIYPELILGWSYSRDQVFGSSCSEKSR